VRFSAKPSPAGDLYLLSGKHRGILTQFQTKVNKKNSSMLDSGCLILEKSFTAENAENAKETQSEILNTNGSPLVRLGCIGKMGKKKMVKKRKKVSKSVKKCEKVRFFAHF